MPSITLPGRSAFSFGHSGSFYPNPRTTSTSNGSNSSTSSSSSSGSGTSGATVTTATTAPSRPTSPAMSRSGTSGSIDTVSNSDTPHFSHSSSFSTVNTITVSSGGVMPLTKADTAPLESSRTRGSILGATVGFMTRRASSGRGQSRVTDSEPISATSSLPSSRSSSGRGQGRYNAGDTPRQDVDVTPMPGMTNLPNNPSASTGASGGFVNGLKQSFSKSSAATEYNTGSVGGKNQLPTLSVTASGSSRAPSAFSSAASSRSNSRNRDPTSPATILGLSSGEVHPPMMAPLTMPLAIPESYVSQVSLKLSEKVNKVFVGSGNFTVSSANGSVTGKGVPPSGDRSRELGEELERTLTSSLPDLYLLRTILRSAVSRSLSIFVSRLSSSLLPLLSNSPIADIVFALPPVSIPQPTRGSSAATSNSGLCDVPAPQKYALEIARCALEVGIRLESVIAQINRKTNGRSRRSSSAAGGVEAIVQALEGWRTKLMEGIVARVMDPILGKVRDGAGDLCAKARFPPGDSKDVNSSRSTSNTANHATTSNGKTRSQSPPTSNVVLSGQLSSLTLPGTAPRYLHELSLLLGSTKLMILNQLGGGTSNGVIENWIAKLAILVAWKTLVAWSGRRVRIASIKRNGSGKNLVGSAIVSSPSAGRSALVKLGTGGKNMIFGRGGAGNTASSVPGSPSGTSKRSPSPPTGNTLGRFPTSPRSSPLDRSGMSTPTVSDNERLVGEMKVLDGLLLGFVQGIVDIGEVGKERMTSSGFLLPPAAAAPNPSFSSFGFPASPTTVLSSEKTVSSTPMSPVGSDSEADSHPPSCSFGKDCEICVGMKNMCNLGEEDVESDTESEDDGNPGNGKSPSLPKQAFEEAIHALRAAAIVNKSCEDPDMFLDSISAAFKLRTKTSGSSYCPNSIRALDVAPSLLVLYFIISRIPHDENAASSTITEASYTAQNPPPAPLLTLEPDYFPYPHQAWNMSWSAWESELKGFYRGGELESAVGTEAGRELEDVIDEFEDDREAAQGKNGIVVPEMDAGRKKWLEILRRELEGGLGVRVDIDPLLG